MTKRLKNTHVSIAIILLIGGLLAFFSPVMRAAEKDAETKGQKVMHHCLSIVDGISGLGSELIVNPTVSVLDTLINVTRPYRTMSFVGNMAAIGFVGLSSNFIAKTALRDKRYLLASGYALMSMAACYTLFNAAKTSAKAKAKQKPEAGNPQTATDNRANIKNGLYLATSGCALLGVVNGIKNGRYRFALGSALLGTVSCYNLLNQTAEIPVDPKKETGPIPVALPVGQAEQIKHSNVIHEVGLSVAQARR